MNIRDIKTKAKSVLVNRSNIIVVFIFISVVTTIINYISETLGVMIPFSHGNIVTALKAVNEQGDEISVEHEGLAGLKRFKELFFTYFLQTAFLMVIMLLICLVLFLIAKLVIDESVFSIYKILLLYRQLLL